MRDQSWIHLNKPPGQSSTLGFPVSRRLEMSRSRHDEVNQLFTQTDTGRFYGRQM